ncbi:ABC transporter permease subunit [Proteiniclasticum sp.]|uniref:ABC transporter permease subunit n=1 Tax=Proteiniclasticum sp. TaxID=2053595 RepID=UPI00289802B2|nr:ABC transporter permease subunit [Proteiniclasticum sp.]
MNVFFQELRFHRKTVLIWNVSLSLTLILMLFVYPAVMSEKASYEAILASLPPGLLEAFSISFDTFMSFNGFLGYTYTYMLIALGVLAMNLGLSALGKEVSRKTADFLMTRPISREKLLSEKVLAGITLITMTNLILGLCIWAMTLVLGVEDSDMGVTLLIILGGYIVQIIFYALGILVGISRKRIRYITSLSLSFVFSFYILAMVSQVVKKEYLFYLSPFRYFDFNYIILNRGFALKYIAVSAAVTVISLGSSYIILKKKEIHV